jgi:hypothetical protein
MAWRIHEQVKRAVFDNRIRGMITGLVWLEGRSDPLRLELWGNAWSDLAGRLIQIENLAFRSGPIEGLATEQRGVCGDLTAVRRGRMPALQPGTGSQPQASMPQIWSTGIYAEWFSERNGRVVTDLLGCCTCVSERIWQPTLDEQLEPAWCNLEAVDAFLRSRARAS